MKQPKYILMHAKNLAIPPGGTTDNTEMIELASLWHALKYIARTKTARAAVLAGRFRWIKMKSVS